MTIKQLLAHTQTKVYTSVALILVRKDGNAVQSS